MSCSTRSFWFGLLAVLLLVLSSSARAEDVRDEARELARQGVMALESGQHAEALELLEQAERKFHAPTHLFYMGRALVGLGRLIEAHDAFVSVQVEPIPNYAPQAFHEAKQAAAKEAAELVGRIATLKIELRGAAAGEATVRVDGKAIDGARLAHPIAVAAGAHVIEASAPGFETTRVSAQARVGETAAIALALAPLADDGSEPEPGGDGARESAGSALTIAGGVVLGLGAASLVAGAVTGAMTLSRASDIKKTCNGDVCPLEQKPAADDAKLLGNVSTATFVVGGVAAAAGIVMLVVGAGGEDEGVAIGVSPTGLSVGGRF